MDGKITYHQQVSYCGKPRCRRCREGIGHGPYWYAYQTVNGRTVRTYVGKEPPAEVVAARSEASSRASQEFAQTILRFSTLGQFRLEQRGGDPQHGTSPSWEQVTDASLQHQRVRSLLSCLVSAPGRKLAREQVMYMLWPELDMETASHRLDRAVHSLRQVFEPGRSRPAASTLLLTEHSTLALAEQTQLWIDADAFEHLLAQARATSDPGQAEQLLEEAARLYGGDFLPDEVAIDAVLSRREALRRGWISLLLELADLRIERESLPGAVEVLDRLLAADTTNEAAAQRQIVLLAQMGRRGEAIAVYQRFASALQQDFKISPLAETRALFDAVLSGRVVGTKPSKEGTPGARAGTTPKGMGRQAADGGGQASEEGEHKGRYGRGIGDKAGLSGNGVVGNGHSLPMELSPLTRSVEHMHIGRTHQSPLVGRDEEIARLNAFLQLTEQTRRLRLAGQKRASLFSPLSLDGPRSPQCLILMGDVGIGKTRLAEEAAREAKRRDWAVAWCRAYTQESNVPYRMWTEILRKAMTQGLWERQELQRRPLIYQPLRALLPELQDLLPQALHTMPAPPEQEQLRLWESTRSLLGTICENTTLLIVLDDVQWADSSSCELLTYLVRQMRGLPVMFLCTCRDTELPASHHLRPMFTDMTREQAIEQLPIAPLSHEEIRELIAHLPAPVVESISTRASGNPFFAEELARGVAAGDLPPELDPADPNALPETITAVLDLRLARITPLCQRLLERAAVLGDAFQFETIWAMASGGAPADEDQILDLLEEALQAGMLTEEGNGSNITYTFWHPLLLTYLYEHLSAARRASLHRRAAQVMQEYYAGRESEGAAEITHHLVYGGAARPLVARYAELAADRAYALSAYPSAEKHYRLALEYLGQLTPIAEQDERLHYAAILERLGECTMIVGKFEEVRRFYEQALDIRNKRRVFASEEERAYEAQIAALIWCEISRAWRYLGNSEKARESFTQGENVLHDAGVEAGPAWARIRYQQGHTLWLEGNLTEALAMGNEALQRFEASSAQPQKAGATQPLTQAQRILNGDPVGLGRVYMLLAGVEATLGQSVKALTHLNQALAVFEQNGIKNEIANVCCNLADMYLRSAEYTLVRSMLTRSYKLAEEIGLSPIMSVALGNLGVLAARLGDLAEAEDWHRQALTLTEQVNDLFYISLFRSYLATALIEQGKLKEAASLLVQALKISRSRRIAPCSGFALVVLGHLRVGQALASDTQDKSASKLEQRNSKEPLLRRARTTLQRALTFDGLEADVMLDGQLLLARIALLLGETVKARALAELALEEARASELVWLQARAQSLLGQALLAEGEQSAAESSFQQALDTFTRTGMRLEHARALAVHASALLPAASSPETRQQALAQLGEARQTFQECHAALDARSVERLLAAQTEPAAPERTARKGRAAGRAGTRDTRTMDGGLQ